MTGAGVLRRRGAGLRFGDDAKWCQGGEREAARTQRRARRREYSLRATKKWKGQAEEQLDTTGQKAEAWSRTRSTTAEWMATRRQVETGGGYGAGYGY